MALFAVGREDKSVFKGKGENQHIFFPRTSISEILCLGGVRNYTNSFEETLTVATLKKAALSFKSHLKVGILGSNCQLMLFS